MQLHLFESAQSHLPIGDLAAAPQTHLPIAAFVHRPTRGHEGQHDAHAFATEWQAQCCYRLAQYYAASSCLRRLT